MLDLSNTQIVRIYSFQPKHLAAHARPRPPGKSLRIVQRRPQPAHRLLPTRAFSRPGIRYPRPCSETRNVPGPSFSLTQVPPRSTPKPSTLSRRLGPRYLLIPNLAPSRSNTYAHPVLCARPAPACHKSVSGPVCRVALQPGGLSRVSHSPGIPSLRKGSVSFPGGSTTEHETAGGRGLEASRPSSGQ
jgi:hypothetical protein